MKISFKSLLNKKEFLLVFLLFVALLLVGYFTFYSGNYYEQSEPIVFEIKSGESLISVADRLEQIEVIPSKTNFRIASFIYGADRRIKAARYNIPNGLSYLQLLDLFIYGPADYLRKVRINDGQTIKWLAAKVKRDAKIDSSGFASLCKDEDFVKSLGIEQKTLEGYLFPGIYEVYENSSPEEVVKIFAKGLPEFWTDSIDQRAKEIGFSKHKVLTLASIVKGETNKVDEMPRIAGVYLNRLRIGMRLQADPTIQYLRPGGWRRLLYNDLKIDSPYNTYRYAGLPPAPINNPGKNPILAVLYPEKHNYLYFVADGKGGHKFGHSYSDHLKNVREYRQWLKSQKK